MKLQYQRNFSSSAFLRLYGYTYYSDWIENGPMMSLQPFAFTIRVTTRSTTIRAA